VFHSHPDGAVGDRHARQLTGSRARRLVRADAPTVEAVRLRWLLAAALAACGSRPVPDAAAQRAAPRDARAADARAIDAGAPRDPIVAIAAGELHSCAVRASGGVVCWGDNRAGQLGDGTHVERARPTAVLGIDDAVDVVAGGRGHSCARRRGGGVACWGDDQVKAADVAGLADVVELGAGQKHTCARRGDGSVWCWGDNSYGQLGDGTFTARARPTRVVGLADAVQLAAGNTFSCAVRAAGPLVCWGNDSDNQLGIPHTAAHVVDVEVGIADGRRGSWPIMEKRYLFARPTVSPVTHDPVAIALGPDLGCAIRRSGIVTCWGSNREGRLGEVSHAQQRDIPEARGALALAVGDLQVCARLPSATTCWGGEWFHTKDGSGIDAHPPHAIALPAPARRLAIGDQHGCAVLATGQVACWGENELDQLGTGMVVNGELGSIDEARGATQLASGYEYGCALRAGRVQCWSYEPSGVQDVEDVGITGAVQLATGTRHGCAVLASHHVTCWGDPFVGALGDGKPSSFLGSAAPVAVAGIDDALEVASSGSHSCVRRMSGAVACWGDNRDAMLGIGSGSADADGNIIQLAPAPVAGISDALELAVGDGFTCARRADRTVACWGANDDGQLGDGSKRTRRAPTPVLGLAGVDQITAGASHACARIAGAVACWGANRDGQLGDGSELGRTRPAPVAGLGDAIAISASGDHTCAVRATGAVVCWGENGAWQLGNGSGPSSPRPQDVAGIDDAVAIATGGIESCVLRKTGEVTCWSRSKPNFYPPVRASLVPRLVALP